jgi:hypothetical protein
MRLSLCSKSETLWDAEGVAGEEEGWAWTEDPEEENRETAARAPDPPGAEREKNNVAVAARAAREGRTVRIPYFIT